MKNKLFALRGISNQGKTSTIKEVYSLLKDHPKVSSVSYEIIGVDIRVVITIGDVAIGIESQGDPNSRLANSLGLFVGLNCQIIVCATRTYGMTVNAVNQFKNNYEIAFIEKRNEPDASKQSAANTNIANQIVSQVKAIFTA